MQLCFNDSLYQVIKVKRPHSQAYSEALRDSLASQAPSHEKDLEKFQKSGFSKFSQLMFATCLQVEALVVRLLRLFYGSLRDFLEG